MGRSALLERSFEDDVCAGLAANGWTYVDGAGDDGWDAELALFPADVLSWLSSQYPEEYAKVVDPAMTGGARTAAEAKLLTHISSLLSRKVQVGKRDGKVSGGLLGLLRNGFKYTQTSGRTATFGPLVAFRPASRHLTKQIERAEANVLRVLRQVRFDTKSTETIDLVLCVNGIPVVTMELKTDNVQSLEHAIRQYRQDRKPTATRRLLAAGRCLVHFAVSNEEVAMTGVLAGADTKFLPFNQGNDGHEGNPPSTEGSATSYLWNWALERELFLRILKDYAVWEPNSSKVGGRLIFPRFHQLRAVEAVTDDVIANGAGGAYLIWHSAGSGKTKTIAWMAHRLARLVDDFGDKVYDSIIVVSDRRALDANLREGIGLMQASEGLVVSITGKRGSKSAQLREALAEGGHIITCTLQTFPEVIDLLEGDEDLAGRNWCVIADEAHSSQSGEASRALRELLTSVASEDEDLSGDDLLMVKDSRMANADNTTFIALTATPKPKTLRLFGTQVEGTERREAFDTYTMAQAIEEGFILDVLENYSTYEMFLQVRDQLGRDDMVDKNAAASAMLNYARMHSASIAQKVAVVIQHFLRNVAHHLDGTAKAMVVTESRQAAFDWSMAVNDYLAEHHLSDQMHALVAFSGTLEVAGEEHTEHSLNGVSDPGAAFKADDSYRVMIVADKYQTGYDEPRLCAMYVDKKLDGIAAVQTLSRLNRIYPDKPTPMIVDFVNEPAVIQAAFAEFYSDAYIETDVDPNVLHNLADVLDRAGIYDEDDMQAISDAYLGGAGHERLRAAAAGPIHRWFDGLRAARLSGDKERASELRDFRKTLRAYEHAWNFLCQIVDYQDADLRRRAIVASVLGRNLIDREYIEPEDYLTGLDVTTVVLTPHHVEEDFSLTEGKDDPQKLPLFDGEHSSGESAPVKEAFDKVVTWLNDHFRQLGMTSNDDYSEVLVKQVFVTAYTDPEVLKIVDANASNPERLTKSKILAKALDNAVFKAIEENAARTEALTSDPDSMTVFRGGVCELLSVSRRPEGAEILRDLVWAVEPGTGPTLTVTNLTQARLFDVTISLAHGGDPVHFEVVEGEQKLTVASPKVGHQDRKVEIRWRASRGGPIDVANASVTG